MTLTTRFYTILLAVLFVAAFVIPPIVLPYG